jgi:iron complex outermembrane recepter protein
MSCSHSFTANRCSLLALSLVLASTTQNTLADETTYLNSVTVSAEPLKDSAVAGTSRTNSGYQINREGVDLWGAPGGGSPYSSARAMPSVNAQSADAYGLSNLPGGTKGMRVRGELATHGSRGTVDGIPLGAVNPGPGYLWLFDAENLSSVSLQQGAVTPDQGNIFTTAGALDSRLRWPEKERLWHLSQALGSSSFTRTQGRVDSGELSSGGAAFFSFSHTAAEKWRGSGNSPDGRDNFALAMTQPLGETVDVNVLAASSDMEAHNYRALSYAQAMDLDHYREFDFSDDPSAGSSYYNYNRQSFKNQALLAEINWQVSSDTSLVLKPYYMDEEGYYLDGQATGKIRQWLIDHSWYGLTTELRTQLAETALKIGYWRQSSEPPGPPTAWKIYAPSASGDLSGEASWSILSKVTDRHLFDSFYLMADHQYEHVGFEAGVRYVQETLPGIDAYDTSGLGDVSYDEALSQSNGVIDSRSVAQVTMHAVLPYLGASYSLSPNLKIKGSLGRNYGAPSFDVWPVYQKKAAAFLANGITADDLWQDLEPEMSDAFDLALRFDAATAWLEPALYVARYHDKKVSYDSDGSGSLPAYSHNVGETRAWGAQLAGGWYPLANLDLFGGISWNRNEFTEDLAVDGGDDLVVSGKQIPDVPIRLANLGLTWHSGEFEFSSVARYTGSRYGDTQHTQSIPGYTTVDLNMGYHFGLPLGRANLSLSVINLFDREYIGIVRSDYYQLLSGGNAIYYPGASRTLMAKIAIDI